MPTLSTIAPFGFDFDTVRFLSAYRALGCTGAQFYRNEQNPPSVSEALAAVQKAGLVFDSIHGVFGEHIDPTSPSDDHQEQCLDIYTQEAGLARLLGCNMVVVHPSGWTPGRRVLTLPEAEAAQDLRWDRLAAFLARLADLAEQEDATFLIENQPFNCHLGHDAPRLAGAIADIASPRIRMCFDTGHAHITAGARGRNLWHELRNCASVVGYIHVHDNDARQDDHRLPGEGAIDWNAGADTLAGIDPSVIRMMEVFYPEARVESLANQNFARELRRMLAL